MRIFLGKLRHAAADFGKEVSRLELQIVVVDEGHQGLRMDSIL